ncbi:MAG: PglZ domain-containing protein [Fermentimonas sp.]|nr:PglZ domain-containing protein [Fermentimonas sp.]
MSKAHFLWVDDEIDLLKPHILFLAEKGYTTVCATNGHDAIEMCRSANYDIIFLDEHMPGLSGLETLVELKKDSPDVPVVMITKSEDEGIMNQAIGRKITDYLIKPVNPNQVLLSIKKILDKRRLVNETLLNNYSEEYSNLNREISSCYSAADWKKMYLKLVRWELELEKSDATLRVMVENQKEDANVSFAKLVRKNYSNWISSNNGTSIEQADGPIMSHSLFKESVLPIIDNGEKLYFILIDNFRLDQWEMVKGIVSEHYDFNEDLYFSILPTATPYSRNALFSGLMPVQISKNYSNLWVDETDDRGKNDHEEELIHSLLSRCGKDISFSYHKLNTNSEAERVIDRLKELDKNLLNVMVFNFIDMLSHAGTESKTIRELASDDSAYRSLTKTWFTHSPINKLLKKIAESGSRVILTSDHGSIRVKKGLKIKGDSETNNNLRYKLGRSLAYDPKMVFDIINPNNYGLPSPNISTRYIFAQNRDFFLYQNNYNHYLNIFEDTYQHGGISMEEMMVPLITLTPKKNK